MYPYAFFAQRLMEMRVEEALRAAELHRLLREAGIQRQGWLSRPGCWLLYQLGRLLVALGQRLQKRFQVPPLSLREQVT